MTMFSSRLARRGLWAFGCTWIHTMPGHRKQWVSSFMHSWSSESGYVSLHCPCSLAGCVVSAKYKAVHWTACSMVGHAHMIAEAHGAEGCSLLAQYKAMGMSSHYLVFEDV